MNTSAFPPSPQTTLAIIMGASAWPDMQGYSSSQSFTTSAQGFRNYTLQRLKLPRANIHDLFDTQISASDHIDEIDIFIEERRKGQEVRDVLIYFVGHGTFDGSSHDHYLLPRTAKDGHRLRSSSIEPKALAAVVKNKACLMRVYLILDCCFSAAAVPSFMGGDEQVAFRTWSQHLGDSPTPGKGIALLCSSDKYTSSVFYPDGTGTAFSRALLYALEHGDPQRPSSLSLSDIKQLTEAHLNEQRRELEINPQNKLGARNIPYPYLYDDQREGMEVSKLPFFPNVRSTVEKLPPLRRRNVASPPSPRPPTSSNNVLKPPAPSVSPPPTRSTRQAPGVTPLPPLPLGRSVKGFKPHSKRKGVVALTAILMLVIGGIWLQGAVNSQSASHIPMQATSRSTSVTGTSRLPAQATGTAVAHAHATGTAIIHAGTATALAQATGTSIAQVGATTTAIAKTVGNPYGGTLTLFDPMNAPGSAFGWDTRGQNLSTCTFKGGGYHVFGNCGSTYRLPGSFAFQISLDAGGSCGILEVYYAPAAINELFLQICQDGYYDLDDHWASPQTGTLSNMSTDPTQNNIIAIAITSQSVSFWVNGVSIVSVEGRFYDRYTILLRGIDKDDGLSSSDYREVVYTDAYLWT